MVDCLSVKIGRTIECDTAVIGGGLGGCAAAIASARGGCDTVLVEAGGTLGGQASIGLVTPMSSMCDAKGISFGGLAEEIKEKSEYYTQKYCRCKVECQEGELSPHMTKYVLLKTAVESGVKIRFYTMLCHVETDNKRVIGVILHDKSGFIRVKAQSYIDGTGDADLAVFASDKYVCGSFSRANSRKLYTYGSGGRQCVCISKAPGCYAMQY